MKALDLIYVRHNNETPASRITASVIRYYELTLLLRGSLVYTANGEKISLKQGDVIFLTPGTIRAREKGSERSDYVSFNFTSEDEIILPTKLEKAIGNELLFLTAAYDEVSRNPYHDNKEKSTHLLACLLLVLEDKIKEKNYNPVTLKIIEYIHANFSQKITLSDIGKATFFSPNYCDSVFRKETGRPIIDYLLEVRMAEAKKLLAEGVLSLSAISEAVGFDDYNYFSRVFKKRTGYTPGEYKKLTSSES